MADERKDAGSRCYRQNFGGAADEKVTAVWTEGTPFLSGALEASGAAAFSKVFLRSAAEHHWAVLQTRRHYYLAQWAGGVDAPYVELHRCTSAAAASAYGVDTARGTVPAKYGGCTHPTAFTVQPRQAVPNVPVSALVSYLRQYSIDHTYNLAGDNCQHLARRIVHFCTGASTRGADKAAVGVVHEVADTLVPGLGMARDIYSSGGDPLKIAGAVAKAAVAPITLPFRAGWAVGEALFGGTNAATDSACDTSLLYDRSVGPVHRELRRLASTTGRARQTRVYIHNTLGRPLVYGGAMTECGHWRTGTPHAFGGRSGGHHVVEPGHWGGVLHTNTKNSGNGSQARLGFVVVTAEGDVFTVVVGWRTLERAKNKCGVVVRSGVHTVYDGVSSHNTFCDVVATKGGTRRFTRVGRAAAGWGAARIAVDASFDEEKNSDFTFVVRPAKPSE